MKNKKQLFFSLIAGLMCCTGMSAQESDFNLAGQRSESQDVLMVTGQRLDHHGIVINPMPHSISIDKDKIVNVSNGVKVNDKKKKFSGDLSFINVSAKGVTQLTIDFGEKIAAKSDVKSVSGAYSIKVDKKGIQIVGYDERGAFYGLQTLREVINSPASAAGFIPYMDVNDYPDLPYRGVVEGFYGTPWSHQVRLSLIDFYGKYKMNSYLYGPKDDPYHSSPNWRLPYPEKEAANIKDLVQACNRNRVEFVWAIHPGKDIKWNEEDYGNLMHKFELMYTLGVRAFAIFFDDIEGEGTNPIKQTELLNRLNKEFVAVKGDVADLVVCPTDYSKLWANPTENGSLSIYGKTLDPSVKVFWTGDVVCSDLTKSTMDWVNSRIKRPAYYWWNYPVTDYVRHIIMQGPVYGLETGLTANDLSGLASNPMEHGEASKLALYGVADYSWNIAGYNPIDNWERGIEAITPEAKDEYRTFAIHSCDTETGYRRSESWETETFRVNNYTESQYTALMSEFEKVEKTPAALEAKCKNKALLGELKPWLTEFGKLGTRGKNTLKLIKLKKNADKAKFWNGYVNNLMTTADREAYSTHRSGTMKLQPFYENAMDDLSTEFFTEITGEIPTFYKGIGTYNNLRTTLNKLMFDNDTTTYYTSGVSQGAGNWIGADLGRIMPVSEVEILQGRNSVNDVDYFDHAVLEYSLDGKSWIALTGNLIKQYVIHWTGNPVEARYIRLKRLESEKKNWASVRTFKVNPVRAEKLPFTVKSDNMKSALFAFDSNPTTSFVNKGTLNIGVKKDATKCILLLKLAPNAKAQLTQTGKDGKTITTTPINNSYMEIDLAKGATQLTIDGTMEIFEVIYK